MRSPWTRPQGSVLGPLLFILYTNDLPNTLTVSKSILFADDTTIYYSHSNLNTLYTNLNKDLQILNDWFKTNKLSLNVSKTQYMIFNKKNQRARRGIKYNHWTGKCKSS